MRALDQLKKKEEVDHHHQLDSALGFAVWGFRKSKEGMMGQKGLRQAEAIEKGVVEEL